MTLALRGGTVIDGTGADPASAEVVMRDGHFVEPGSADEVLDVAGLTVLPGLIDAHSHLGLIGDLGAHPWAVQAARIFRNCELALDAGFTTVRDVGGLDGGVAQAVASGLVRGPRILPSGPIICRTGGHGDNSPVFHDLPTASSAGLPGLTRMAHPVDGADAMRTAARLALRRGATQLKVCVTGGFADYRHPFDDVEFAIEELQAAVAEADAASTYVTAHAHHSHGIQHGLDAGVSCFEHGTFLDEQTAAAMAAAGACLVPTLAVVHVLSDGSVPGIPTELAARAVEFEQAMAAAVKLATAAGVVVGSGSDFTGVEQDRRGLELVLRAGIVGAMGAITTATSTNARVLRRPNLGRIALGSVADVIAVDGDPLTEPELFEDPRRVRLVVKDGMVVKDTR